MKKMIETIKRPKPADVAGFRQSLARFEGVEVVEAGAEVEVNVPDGVDGRLVRLAMHQHDRRSLVKQIADVDLSGGVTPAKLKAFQDAVVKALSELVG